jgi:hypothetical protein
MAKPRAWQVAAVFAVVAIASAAPPAGAAWLADVEIGAFHDDNLTRADAPADRRADSALAARASLGRRFEGSNYDALTLSAEIAGEAYDRYPGLDYAAIGAALVYRRKLGLGLLAPHVAIAASAVHASYREDVRDGTRLVFRVEAGKRFDEAVSVVVGASHDRRNGESDVPVVPGISGAIFDLSGYGAHVLADYAPTDRWLFAARAAVRRGDVESTSQRSFAAFRASDAIAEDPAFGDPALFGYRLRGTTVSAAIGVSFALHDRASLNAGYLFERTRASEGLEYVSRIVNATFAYRFSP